MAVILVTGSSTGIGQEAVLHMARKGHKVFASLRNPAGADELRAKIDAENLDIDIVQLDVTDVDSVASAVAGVLQSAGRIDALVNNAGIGGGASVEETSLDEARKVFDTNYFGQVEVLRAVLPGMRKQRSGALVMVSSMVAQIPLGCHGHYGASKIALEGLSEALAQEVAEFNIRVAVVEPGVVLTPVWGKSSAPIAGPYDNSIAKLGRFFGHATKRPAATDDVASAIAHAIESDTPQFRYRVGVDAEELIGAREKVSDETWVQATCLPDGQFEQRMAELIGADYYGK